MANNKGIKEIIGFQNDQINHLHEGLQMCLDSMQILRQDTNFLRGQIDLIFEHFKEENS